MYNNIEGSIPEYGISRLYNMIEIYHSGPEPLREREREREREIQFVIMI